MNRDGILKTVPSIQFEQMNNLLRSRCNQLTIRQYDGEFSEEFERTFTLQVLRKVTHVLLQCVDDDFSGQRDYPIYGILQY